MKDFDSNFIDDGFVDLGPVLDKTKCRELLEKVYETRSFGPELFIDEKQHRINPKWAKNNPGPGINLTEKFNLDFIDTTYHGVYAIEYNDSHFYMLGIDTTHNDIIIINCDYKCGNCGFAENCHDIPHIINSNPKDNRS